MGKSRKAGKTLTHTKEQTPLLPLSGNLQENLEASPCPVFSRATRRRRHRSVRGQVSNNWCCPHRDQYVYFIYASYHCLFCCKRCIDSNHNEQLIDSDGFKSIWRHLHAFSRATSKLLSFLVLRSLCMTSDCCRLLCRIVSPAQTVPSTSGGKSPQISEADKTRLEMQCL